MSQFDHLDLDGHLLRLLLAVVEEGSVTQAAQRLGVTQSAVSHLLDKLRAIVGDPLFVKSGRGIVPTARAQALAIDARRLLDELRSFSSAAEFDPAKLSALVTIAANDLQRDLLLPSFLRYVRGQAPGFALRVIQSGAPTAEPARHYAAAARGLGCPAEAALRGQLPRVLRRESAQGAGDARGLPCGRPRHRIA
jgi:DNA-binding transcriptional LysR family regulator